MADSNTAQAQGRFTRDTRYIETRVTADRRDGYPVEPDTSPPTGVKRVHLAEVRMQRPNGVVLDERSATRRRRKTRIRPARAE